MELNSEDGLEAPIFFPHPCVFRSNHASNYVSLRGNLPEDRERMLKQLEAAMNDIGLLKDERFRML